jgi:hypothetical protein
MAATNEAVLDDLALAIFSLRRLVTALEEKVLDPALPSNEKQALLAELPILDNDRRDLAARFAAMQAKKAKLPPPNESIAKELKAATTDLSARIAEARSVSALLTLATTVASAAWKAVAA